MVTLFFFCLYAQDMMCFDLPMAHHNNNNEELLAVRARYELSTLTIKIFIIFSEVFTRVNMPRHITHKRFISNNGRKDENIFIWKKRNIYSRINHEIFNHMKLDVFFLLEKILIIFLFLTNLIDINYEIFLYANRKLL